MKFDEFLPLSSSFLRREEERLKYIFESLTKGTRFEFARSVVRLENKNILTPSANTSYIPTPEQSVRIATSGLKLLNHYLSDERGPLLRKDELDENGKPAFYLSHPIKVVELCIKNLPPQEELSSLPEKESTILENVHRDPYETAVTAFLHDFVEDAFEGDFQKKDPKTNETAEIIIKKWLGQTELGIPEVAQKRIFDRLVILTKPSTQYDKSLSEDKNTDLYLKKYEEYLQKIIDSNCGIAQYVKFMDILQNAQSQKNTQNKKRIGKAKLQASFVEKIFPEFSKKIVNEHPVFFEKMNDQNFVEALKNNIAKNVQKIIDKKK